MASPCGGTGLFNGRRCPQCFGSPNQDIECSEAQRRGPGAPIPIAWESPEFFTSSGAKVTVRHPLGRVPAFVEVLWKRMPRYKAAMAGGAEAAADVTFTINRRTTTEVEVQFDITAAAGAEPGTYRLKVSG
jgi:hypothetical protein